MKLEHGWEQSAMSLGFQVEFGLYFIAHKPLKVFVKGSATVKRVSYRFKYGWDMEWTGETEVSPHECWCLMS